jgi:hypothetical protein
MKRLIASLAVSLGLVLANVSIVRAAEQWRLEMFNPAASTTNRTINIEYKVFSVVASDKFEVKLFQNNVEIGTQNIDTDHGDSSVFSVNIPTTGTYTYRIDATNSGDIGNTESKSRTVEVVDGPAPTVTTVFVNNGAAGGQGAGGAQTAAAGGAGAGGSGASGQVAGETADEGTVSAEGSATDENSENPGDVLGDSETTANNNRRRNITLGVALVLVVAGAAYYWFLARPRNSA